MTADITFTEAQLRGTLDAAIARALARPEVAADASRCRASIALNISTTDTLAHVGSITLWPGESQGHHLILSAPIEVWTRVFCPQPPVGFQSLGALRRQCPAFQMLGDALATAQALPFVERLLEAIRTELDPAPVTAPCADVHGGLRHLRGRYLPLRVKAREDWVFTEQAGKQDGPALLMLHTAGADARQWHGLMAQPALREHWSLHAFDLPGHGRSPLPAGQPNWHWRLTEDQYIDWVIAYLDAAGLRQVALMGCSMGAAIGLALLARHPARFSGAVLLEVPYRSPGRRSAYLNHPEVHGGRLGAAWVGSLLSPVSPRACRDQATWIYSQAAPGVYDGDLAFYSDDFDAHHHTARIDAHRTPLWLLTGDYDYSATPQDSRRVASEIPGAHFAPLPGFGHFPMVENPLGLMPYLLAPLDALRSRMTST